METKIEDRLLRAGDVFLEKDGWGLILGRPILGSDGSVHTLAHINDRSVVSIGYFFNDIKEVKKHLIDRQCVFMYNACDIFDAAKKAINEDTNP